jgi:hypothetical protein
MPPLPSAGSVASTSETHRADAGSSRISEIATRTRRRAGSWSISTTFTATPDDIDGILPDFIEETMPELQGCAFVAAFTSSAGVTRGNRVRLVFELEEARTLAAMRSFAQTVNQRAAADVIDGSLYTPGHLVLTAAPRLFADVAQGATAETQHLTRPVRSTAWFVDGSLANIPDAPVTFVTGAGYVPKGQRNEAMGKAEAADLLQSVGPGNYSVKLHSWLCHVAWNAPEHRRDSDFNSAVSAIQDRIRETSEPARLAERLRTHGNLKALRKAWDGALARRAAYIESKLSKPSTSPAQPPTAVTSLADFKVSTAGAADFTGKEESASTTPVVPPPVTIADVRAQLKADVAREVAEIIGGATRHVLFLHPPGAGKTTGVLSAINAGRFCSDRIRYRASTHKLAEEFVGKLKAHAQTLAPGGMHHGIDLAAGVRHHKGRAQPGLCPDPISKPLADRAESLGVSVKKHVCANCATGKADTCPWLAQADDTDAGVVVEAHHAAFTPSKQPADLVINDEGTLGATIESGGEPVEIAALTKTDTIHDVGADNTLGWKRLRETHELQNYRTDLVRALRASVPTGTDGHGRLESSAIPSLVSEVTYEARIGLRAGERRDWLRTAPGWAKAALLDPEADLAVAEAEVATRQAERLRRKKRADAHIEMLWRFVLFEAVRHAPRAATVGKQQVSLLLVAQKATLERLQALGLPPTVAMVHFGALRGLDAFRDVPCCVVIGRPRPADIDLELQTEALHMHNPAIAEIGRRRPGHWTEQHPDPLVGAVQQVTTTAEVKQAVARMRPYDRTSANPCTIHVFGTYDPGLPGELVQTRLWADADRSPAEVALAYGAAFSDNRLNQQAFAGLFPKGNAAGNGQADLQVKSRFAELSANLRGQIESAPYPYSKIQGMTSTGAIRSTFGDALAYPGCAVDPGRSHRLVKLRTAASRKASFALIDARWGQAAVEARLRVPLTYWRELDAQEVLATRWGGLAGVGAAP